MKTKLNNKDIAKKIKDHTEWLKTRKVKGKRADFSMMDLSDRWNDNFSRANLSRAQFQYSNMTGLDVRDSILNDCNFQNADMRGMNFSNSSLINSNFASANLTNCGFSCCDLTSVKFSGANLVGCNFFGANLERACFIHSNLSIFKPLLADTARLYVLYVIENALVPYFIAGCRTYTYEQAIEHWSDKEYAQPKYVKAINAWKKSSSY